MMCGSRRIVKWVIFCLTLASPSLSLLRTPVSTKELLGRTHYPRTRVSIDGRVAGSADKTKAPTTRSHHHDYYDNEQPSLFNRRNTTNKKIKDHDDTGQLKKFRRHRGRFKIRGTALCADISPDGAFCRCLSPNNPFKHFVTQWMDAFTGKILYQSSDNQNHIALSNAQLLISLVPVDELECQLVNWPNINPKVESGVNKSLTDAWVFIPRDLQIFITPSKRGNCHDTIERYMRVLKKAGLAHHAHQNPKLICLKWNALLPSGLNSEEWPWSLLGRALKKVTITCKNNTTLSNSSIPLSKRTEVTTNVVLKRVSDRYRVCSGDDYRVEVHTNISTPRAGEIETMWTGANGYKDESESRYAGSVAGIVAGFILMVGLSFLVGYLVGLKRSKSKSNSNTNHAPQDPFIMLSPSPAYEDIPEREPLREAYVDFEQQNHHHQQQQQKQRRQQGDGGGERAKGEGEGGGEGGGHEYWMANEGTYEVACESDRHPTVDYDYVMYDNPSARGDDTYSHEYLKPVLPINTHQQKPHNKDGQQR